MRRGALATVTDAVGGSNSTPQTASVNLPAPLVIHGNAMAVSLDLQVSPSATTFTNQGAWPPDTYAITPTFTLTPVAPVPQSQVQIMGVDGLVSSITSGSNSLSLMIAYGFNNPSYPDGSTFTVATNASTASAEVYVDSNTQMLNSNAIAPGNVLRFHGLIFNDSGTARMVCSLVHGGVAE